LANPALSDKIYKTEVLGNTPSNSTELAIYPQKYHQTAALACDTINFYHARACAQRGYVISRGVSSITEASVASLKMSHCFRDMEWWMY
jgi:hypothetical protein